MKEIKKGYTMTLIGILCNVAGIAFSIPYLNIAGFVLMCYGIKYFDKENRFIKKVKTYSAAGILSCAVAIIILYFVKTDASLLVIAVETICTIYSSYYFTEFLIQEAGKAERSAASKSFRICWILSSGTLFLYYIAYMSGVTNIIFMAEILALISGVYFIFSISNGCKLIFYSED